MGKSNKFSLTSKSHSASRVNPYDKITLNALNVSCPDKQIVLPKLEANGVQLVFIELYSLLIFIIALGTQYLNLYRSVWWLSKTRSAQPINYHLIDLDVSQFALIFIGQSSLISILRALLERAATTQQAQSTTTTSLLSLSFGNFLAQQHLHQQQTSSPSNSLNVASTTTTNSDHNKQQSSQAQTASNSSTSSINSNGTNGCGFSKSNCNSTTSTTTLTTIVTAAASWICNYYLFKCAYRIWNNFGLNGISCISYPIVSILSLAHSQDLS